METGVRTDVPPAELARELDTLRRQVEALTARLDEEARLTLEPELADPFLGQPVRLVARVVDARGRPRAGVEVTFVASWGKLRTSDGYVVRESGGLTARTFPDGTARVTLLPPTREQLSQGQIQALSAGLRNLDAQAAGPGDTEAGFEEMVRQYSWEANFLFRQAVDIIFQQFRDGSKQRVNLRDTLRAWAEVGVSVIAFVSESPAARSTITGRGRVEATAVVSLRLKDWLDPWLEIFQRVSEEEGSLAAELEEAKQPDVETGVLLEGVFDRVQGFVGRQRGVVGELVGQRVAEGSLRRFATQRIEEIPSASRQALFSGLDVASRTVGRAGVTVLSGVGQARSEVRQELDQRVSSIGVDQVQGLPGRLAGIDGVVGLKADTTALVTVRQELTGEIAAKVDQGTFQTIQADVDARLAAKIEQPEMDRLRGDLDLFREDVGQRLAVKVDQETFARELSAKVDDAAFQGFQDGVNGELGSKADLGDVTSLLAAKVDVVAFGDFESTLSETLAAKADQESFDTLRSDVEINLVSLQDKVTDYQVLEFVGLPSGGDTSL